MVVMLESVVTSIGSTNAHVRRSTGGVCEGQCPQWNAKTVVMLEIVVTYIGSTNAHVRRFVGLLVVFV